jgi:hypothetical protein
VADEGCVADEPVSVEQAPPLSQFVHTCVSEDEASMLVTNISQAVLDISPTDAYADTSVQAAGGDNSFAAAAVAQFVTSECDSGDCVIGPGDGVLVEGEAPIQATVDLDPVATGEAEAARFVGGWVDQQLRGDIGAFLDSVTACADDIETFSQEVTGEGPIDPETFYVNAMSSVESCKGLVNQVHEEAVVEAEAANEAARLAALEQSTVTEREAAAGDGVFREAKALVRGGLLQDLEKLAARIRP